MDAVGGDLNAFTSHEYTCYYAHVLASEARMAVELVCDVVLDASITSADVDVERQVILEEIAMRDDDPEDVLNDMFSSTVFTGDLLERPVIGTVETIEALTRSQIAGYYRRRYDPTRMVVSVAGGIDAHRCPALGPRGVRPATWKPVHGRWRRGSGTVRGAQRTRSV